MQDWRSHIGSDPAVVAGKPVVKGTGLAVDFVLGLFAQGWSEAQVLTNYPQLTRKDIRAVFAYAAACIGDEEFLPL